MQPLSIKYNAHSFPCLFWAASISIGIASYQYYPLHVHNYLYILLVTLLFVTILTVYYYLAAKIRGKIILATLLMAIIGFLRASQFDIKNSEIYYGNYLSKAQAFELNINGTPHETDKSIKYEAVVMAAKIGDKWQQTKGEIILYVYKNPIEMPLSMDDKVIIKSGKIMPIPKLNNPFSFNYADYIKRQNIYYQSFVSPDEILISRENTPPSALQKARAYSLARLDASIKDTIANSITKAMILNEKGDLEASVAALFSQMGITHIISISGMHLTSILWVFTLILIWKNTIAYRRFVYIIGIIIVWSYIILVGFPPSGVRAAIGFSIFGLGVIFLKKANGLNVLGLTGAIMLLINPNWLFDVGVQLSFAAVASILIFYPSLQRVIKTKYKVSQYLWNVIAVTIAAQIFTFPLVIYYFHQFPFWFLPANIFGTLYSDLVLLFGILIIILGKFTFIATILGNIIEFLTHNLQQLLKGLSALSPTIMQHLYISPTRLYILLITVFIFTIAFINRKKNAFKLVGISIACFGIINFIELLIANKQHSFWVMANAKSRIILSVNGRNATWHYEDSILENKYTKQFLDQINAGFRIKNQSIIKLKDTLILVNNKTVLLLDSAFYWQPNFHLQADYIIINNNALYHFNQWKNNIQAKAIVADASVSQRFWNSKSDSIKHYFPNCYAVNELGAFKID